MLFALCAAERERLYGGGDCPDHEETQKAKELMISYIHMSGGLSRYRTDTNWEVPEVFVAVLNGA